MKKKSHLILYMVKFSINLDVYQDKFKDLFDLNDNITHQLDIFKQKIAEKENQIDMIEKENRDYIEYIYKGPRHNIDQNRLLILLCLPYHCE